MGNLVGLEQDMQDGNLGLHEQNVEKGNLCVRMPW
jgi:hypothetical protein